MSLFKPQSPQIKPQTSPPQIQDWLTEADDYLETGDLVTPASANAYTTLQKVLAQEPDNAEAQAGMEELKDELFARATMAQAQGEPATAGRHLEALLKVDPQSERARQALDALTKMQEDETPAKNDVSATRQSAIDVGIDQDIMNILESGLDDASGTTN